MHLWPEEVVVLGLAVAVELHDGRSRSGLPVRRYHELLAGHESHADVLVQAHLGVGTAAPTPATSIGWRALPTR